MRSPDPFADDVDEDSNDSFDNFVATPSIVRRRSEAIVADSDDSEDADSFDAVLGESEQITVIENRGSETVLMEGNLEGREELEEDADDTITRLLESSSDEEDVRMENGGKDGDVQDDALSNLLKSFRETRSEEKEKEADQEEEENGSNVSLDVLGDGESVGEEEMPDDEITLLPVAVPDALEEPAAKRRRHASEERVPPTSSSSASTAHGPPGIVSSDVGEYWNQQKTVEIHGKNYEINSFADYMRMKIAKLNHQVNEQKSKPFEKVSEIFKGFSVFVNGYTDPPALVIRDLMMSHGGEYHCYYMHGRTSYVIASSIATAKIDRIREKEIFIRADWITESIAAGRPLDYRDFLIYEKGAQEKGNMRQFLTSSAQKSPEDPAATSSGFLDARNPNFIRDYYARSRLHLISTLAQDMKDFVANLKMDGKMTKKPFPEEELKELGSKEMRGTKRITVFHVDLDCFFVSVAMRDREDLRGKEVAITHSKGTITNSMSEVASCSYAARSCGVRNGMLVRDALQKCPQLTLLPYQFDDYISVSRQIYQILASYTLDLRAVSCDEMYINVTDLCEQHSIEDPVRLAEHIRKVIRTETRCSASVGIGGSSLLARLATRHAKPDGVYWVREEKRNEFMAEERISDLPGLGYQMLDRLVACFGDISKCGQLQQRTERDLAQVFGPKHASKIFKQCRGTEEDSEDFWKTQTRKSVSCDINYGIRFTKRDELVQLITAIGAELERKLSDCKMSAGSITLKLMVRSADAPLQTAKFMGHGRCDTFTKTSNLSVPTVRCETLSAEAMKLYGKIAPKVEDLRGVGVTCGKLKSKTRKDVVTAVQQMFGLARKEDKTEEARRRKKATRRGAADPEDDEDVTNDDEEMRRRVIEPSLVIPIPGSEQPKSREIPHPKDVKLAEGVFLPKILTLSEIQIRRAVRKLKIDGKTPSLETKLEALLKKEPTESSVQAVQSILESLLKAGKLATFEKIFRNFERNSGDSKKSHVAWFSVFHAILQNLKRESKNLLEFPIESTERRVSKREHVREGEERCSRRDRIRFVPEELIVMDSTIL